jgi:hypothetical protein
MNLPRFTAKHSFPSILSDLVWREVSPHQAVPSGIGPMYCTPDRLRDLETRKNAACQQPRSCNVSQSCDELLRRELNGVNCYSLRDQINNECFGLDVKVAQGIPLTGLDRTHWDEADTAFRVKENCSYTRVGC